MRLTQDKDTLGGHLFLNLASRQEDGLISLLKLIL